ncbi:MULTISPECIES: carboxylesterase/lipase family protein [unclassified Arthrobacter]|uniref:carboxylesterase/lipase family protein n=1 Tax=unclassified Arthrobacter TaxID=235627 RepID=UPI0024DF9E05|nr:MULTISPECIES: carboxylesterase/lipase family protein [unclassified Arthrobacter]MCC9145305.1 carboxylesterase/lipase family protein [Arthrobacter sp. zg-Y919]MDK1276533.1 carboxylesterase/lipase family protein [Arthrobacter sp. zg.Y919]WIB01874.1 carboxylesterase/lipase family protein [Arthrobacter sp. zg-Y919]
MAASTVQPDLVVETTDGPVRGIVVDGVRAWRGIPYAAPPTGALRLRLPQPVHPWTDERDASRYGPVPPQEGALPSVGAGRKAPMDEDCLTINVTAPLEKAPPRPVLVYFYGGGFTTGAASSSAYNGRGLVERGDVVYVCMNYRLGALGFMDFRRYSTPERPFDVNTGLADQVAALRWVQRNIARFGGDPGNVTVFGESAGAMSITALMCVPAAEGLFHKAFVQSSAPATAYGPELPEKWAATLMELLGVPEAGAGEALSTLPPRRLVEAVNRLTRKIAPETEPGARAVAPVVDGDFLPQHPIDAFRAGRAHRIPLVIGTTHREGALFDRMLDILPTTQERIDRMFSRTEPGLKDQVLAAYPGYPSKRAAVDVGGDVVFWLPSVQVAEAHSAYAPTWSYRFDYAARSANLLGLGATHGMDIPAAFGNFETSLGRFQTLLGGKRTAVSLGHRFSGALLRFARTGSPGLWPAYDTGTRTTKIFDSTDRVVQDPHRIRRQAWNGYRGYR